MSADALPGAPLDAAQLESMEKRVADLTGTGMLLRAEQRILREDVPTLVAALRAAWRENERYRAALAHYADESNWTRLPPPDDVPTENWGTWPDDWYCPKGRDRNGYDAARAALGAPGAREEAP